MGNFSSCTVNLSSHKLQSLPSSSVSALTPPVARVLLIDGSMLKFKAQIKVIKLLLDYPNHVICPLDSLKPGLHSLSSLLPDEKLQLGRFYLLLPLKTHNMQGKCSKSKQVIMPKREGSKERDERKRLLPKDKSDVSFASCAESGKNGDVGLCDNKLQACGSFQAESCPKKNVVVPDVGKCSAGKQRAQVCENLLKSEVGFVKCGELYKNGDVGRQQYSRRSAGSYTKLSEKRRGRREVDRYGKEKNDTSAINGGFVSGFSSKSGRLNLGPLCDTPELQRAYRSFLLRRSSSWTPRLQPIIERR
eukprot:c19477_g1_i1 orf=89-1000(-)